ncbi:MAG TPA: nucleotidyltransferase domain-containing protein [Ktedonobacteraceae bacterium]|nr:nucleotidyltransferase domain-containing protein [Ktedonobacteraceae bacterium]
MNTSFEYPGTPQHQQLLQQVVSYYAGDPRILSVVVFGSLGRGNWDRYSDLDLDIIIADGITINIMQELSQLCESFTAIDEHAALIIPNGEDVGDIVLESLLELSIRYHQLQRTSPNIVSSMQVLSGQVDSEIIKVAGLANRQVKDRPLTRLLDMCVRYAVDTDVFLQRRQLWGAIETEHRMRNLLMELYAQAHGGVRPLQFFEAEASAPLQTRLGATLPQYQMASAQEALIHFLDILEQDVDLVTGGQIQLTAAHHEILKCVRMRQANLQWAIANSASISDTERIANFH